MPMKLPRHRLRAAALAALLVAATGCSSAGGQVDAGDASNRSRSAITVSIYDRGTIPSSEGTIANNKITQWINDAGPVDVRFVPIPRTRSEETMSVLFASDEAPDLILEYAPQMKYTWMDQQLLRPLDDMIERYSTTYKELLRQFPELRIAGTGADGKLYQLGRINETIPQRGMFIRKDWLDKLNLPVPKTTEELYEAARAFTLQDPDGNGIDDTYGIAMSYNSGEALDEMFGVTYPDYVLQDGELVHGWDHIEAVTAFKKRLYAEGLTDPYYYTDKNGTRAKWEFITGKVGIMLEQFNVPMMFYTEFYEPLKRHVPDAELAVMPYPSTPVGSFNPIFVNPVQMTAVVNARAGDPEAVMAYVDFAASPAFMKTMYYGFEGVHSETKPDACPRMTDLAKWRTEFNYGSGDFAMLASPILSGSCHFGAEKLDVRDPDQLRVKELFELNSSYVDFDLPVAGPTHSEHMPQPPKELQEILKQTVKRTSARDGDIWTKAVLTPSYSAAEAKADAIAAWEKAGGRRVDEWYRNFYANERHRIILTEDIYRIFKQQRAMSKQ